MPGSSLTSVPGTTTYMNTVVASTAVNYVTDTGASNALEVALTYIDGTSVPLAAGLRLLVNTANTLQAGANTLALNGGAAKSLKNNGTVNNLKTTTAAGVLLDVVYDGTNWIILNSTY